MFNKKKGLVTGTAVTLVVSITVCIVFSGISNAFDKEVSGDAGNKTGFSNDSVPAVEALPIDTHYVPLPDINSEKVVEHTIHGDQIIINEVISNKTEGYARVLKQNPDAILLVDEKGNYIAVGRIEQNGGYSDICITKYDSKGRELKRQIYGGSDFDWANAAKYNSKMGLVISGISQSQDGDFANNSNSPFVACIDPETLAVRWISSVQIADWVYHVSNEAVYVVRNEGEKYNGKNELKLSIVKLDRNGNKVWATEPLSQWICGITELRDGRVIVIQKFCDQQAVEKSGAINCYSKDGAKLLTFKADCYGDVKPINDGGFTIVSVRNIKTISQPAYISSIWYDTETVVTKYNKNYKIEWRKTYDSSKEALGVDRILPLNDGSVALED